MDELRSRLAVLPMDAAIIYTSIYRTRDDRAFVPVQALKTLAGVANRPIVVDTDTQLGTGSIGGFV